MSTPLAARPTQVHAAILHLFGDLRGRLDADLAALGFAPDGTLVAVEDGGTFRRWNASTLDLLEAALLGDEEIVWTFSDDRRWLAGGGASLSLWNVERTPIPIAASDDGWATAMAFSPDGAVLAVGCDDGRVRFWSVPELQPRFTLTDHDGPISALAFSVDGAILAAADEGRNIRLWKWREGKLLRTLVGSSDRIDAIAWRPDGRRLASAGWDRSVRIWNSHNGELLALLNDHSLRVHAACFVPNTQGKLLASGDSSGGVRIWNVDTLTVERRLVGPIKSVSHLSFSPDGAKLAAGGEDRVVNLWDWAASEPLVENLEPCTAVIGVAVGGEEAAVVHSEGVVQRWSLSSGKRSAPVDVNVTAAAHHPKCGWAYGTKGGSVWLPHVEPRIWRSHDGAVRRLAFNPAGDHLLTVHDGDSTLRIWETATSQLKVVAPEAALGGAVEMVAFHPRDPIIAVAGVDWRDGRFVDARITMAEWENYVPPEGVVFVKNRSAFQPDGAVVIWDVRDWMVRQVLDGGALRVAFHPSGRCLATVSVDGGVLVWDHVTGELLYELSSQETDARDLAFDPSGRYLVAGGGDGALRIWDCKTWKIVAVEELDALISSLAFSPEGARLVAGFTNGAAALLKFAELVG